MNQNRTYFSITVTPKPGTMHYGRVLRGDETLRYDNIEEHDLLLHLAIVTNEGHTNPHVTQYSLTTLDWTKVEVDQWLAKVPKVR